MTHNKASHLVTLALLTLTLVSCASKEEKAMEHCNKMYPSNSNDGVELAYARCMNAKGVPTEMPSESEPSARELANDLIKDIEQSKPESKPQVTERVIVKEVPAKLTKQQESDLTRGANVRNEEDRIQEQARANEAKLEQQILAEEQTRVLEQAKATAHDYNRAVSYGAYVNPEDCYGTDTKLGIGLWIDDDGYCNVHFEGF